MRAAGGVLWRSAPDGSSGMEVALVHRPRYDDWSLPKGKLLAAEDGAVGAVREVQEETGFSVVAGRALGTTGYDVDVDGRTVPKVVEWWAMRVVAGRFVANSEVDELRWCDPATAVDQLTAGRDADRVRVLLDGGWAHTTSVLVRHGSAGSRKEWGGEDDARPLTAKGHRQAAGLGQQLRVFGVQRVLSAPPLRCVQTVQPLARALGVDVEVDPRLGEQAYGEDPGQVTSRVQGLAAEGGVVLCSQGGTLPGVLHRLAERSGLALAEAKTGKGTAWVLSLAGDRLVAADRRPPPA